MQNCALILIDVQKAFNEPDWGQRNNHNAETNISDLLGAVDLCLNFVRK